MKILAPAKEVDAEPKGKNKRMALEAAKGGESRKAARPKARLKAKPAEGEAENRPNQRRLAQDLRRQCLSRVPDRLPALAG